MPGNVILGLVDALKADSTVAGLVGANAFDFELDPTIDFTMPVKAIVVKPQGGASDFRWLQLKDQRVQVICYGETPNLAYTVYRAAYLRLKNLTPSVWSATYIHWANESTGPMPFRDPTLQWPYNVSSWTVRISDVSLG